MKDKKIISVLLVGIVFCIFVSGCKKKIPQPRDPAVIYNEGIAMMSSSGKHTFLNPPDYEKARKAFQEILYDHPTSEYAPLAELKIADTYYEEGNYDTAATAYDAWRKYHIGRPEIPYVTYRLGMCYYHQVRSIDRDQTNTRLALLEFQTLITTYPNSEYAAAVGDKTEILRTKLAEHEFYVGKFYYRHRDYWSAVDRFKGILQNYPKRGLDEKSLFWLWRSYVQLGRFDRADPVYNELLQRFPEGRYARQARILKTEKSGKKVREWLTP